MPSIRLTVHSALAAALIVMAWPRTSAAQDPIQETVVVTATASPVRLSEIGRQLLVITREQIEALPVQSVPELLSYLASVDVRTRGTSGVQADVSIRGGSFGQTLVLVDGVRMNDAQSAHHNMDLPVLLEDVERIELLAGPSASVARGRRLWRRHQRRHATGATRARCRPVGWILRLRRRTRALRHARRGVHAVVVVVGEPVRRVHVRP